MLSLEARKLYSRAFLFHFFNFKRASYAKRHFLNRAWLFHGTAAPDVSYIVFNIVEIFVYKVQWRLIFS